MIQKTPGALLHLLNGCVYKEGKKSFVDFFIFHNLDGGSELNLLKIIVHFKKFDLLRHPICELFLHLKSKRARWIHWIVLFIYLTYENGASFISSVGLFNLS